MRAPSYMLSCHYADIWFHCVHYVPVMPGDEGILNVTLVIGDELANQGFTAITNQGKRIFIYLYS